MYEYINGKITDIQSGYIVLENNGIGYLVYTANPYSFDIGGEYKIYIYQYIREDENTLYGFKSYEEKDLFLRLTSVKGLGCKMAMPMLAGGSPEGIIDAINNNEKYKILGMENIKRFTLDAKVDEYFNLYKELNI